jgi:signal transduction histidine kinase
MISYTRQRDKALASMSLLASQTGQVIEHILEEDMLLADFESIQTTFDAIGENERLRTLLLLDPTGRVVFSPQVKDVDLVLSEDHATCRQCHDLPPEERPSGIVVNSDEQGSVFRSMTPIENQSECHQCHDPDQRLLGLLLTDFSITAVESSLTSDLHSNLAWWAGTLLVTAIVTNLAFDNLVLRRLGGLAQAIAAFGRGGVHNRLAENPKDEIGNLSEAFNSMVTQVENREHENSELSAALKEQSMAKGRLLRKLISAQEDERKRLARELHDDLGQTLGSTALNIEIARRSAKRDPEAIRDHLTHAQELLSEASDRMYDLIMGLRPSVLDDLGLVAALKMQLSRCLEPAGIVYELHAEGLEGRLPPEIELVLFRIFQEALTNVARHSQASRAILRLTREGSFILAEIQDDGVGFKPDSLHTDTNGARGFGLLGMRERVEQCAGNIEFRSDPGDGTLIRVRIPIVEEPNV